MPDYAEYTTSHSCTTIQQSYPPAFRCGIRRPHRLAPISTAAPDFKLLEPYVAALGAIQTVVLLVGAGDATTLSHPQGCCKRTTLESMFNICYSDQ